MQEAHKVYPDGHEELVRNLKIQGFMMSAFKDTLPVSDTPAVITAVPSLRIDDLTLQRPTGEIRNLPFTKHPAFEH